LASQVTPAKVAETLQNNLEALAGPEGLW